MDLHRRLASLALALLLVVAAAPPARADSLDFAIPGGHFFKQANGLGGAGDLGFAVRDDLGTDPQSAHFWSEFQRLGGVGALGYPVSHRFIWDGFLVQAFQKAVLQWRPEARQAYFVNVFDRLSAAGKDPWLDSTRQTPPSFDNAADAGLAWGDVVKRHLALLDANPAIKATYQADADPIAHFGLPMGWKDYGNVFVVRCQRAVFQQWKVDEPWAKAGQVVVANGGDVAKEAGLYPEVATMPQVAPPTTLQVENLLVGPGTPGRLYALQGKTWYVGPDVHATERLLTSDDLGATWREFSGGLPVDPSCLHGVSLDYATPDALYAATCRGIYRWDGGRWVVLTPQPAWSVAIAYGKPSTLLATVPGPNGNPPVGVMRSDDGGQTWSYGGLGEDGSLDVAINPRDPSAAYALSGYKSYWYTLYRGFARPGQWTRLPLPVPPGSPPLVHGMTLDGSNGALYLAAREIGEPAAPSEWLLLNATPRIWRAPNPNAPNPQDVRWELVHEFGENVDAQLLASGAGPGGLMLFANLGLAPEGPIVSPFLYRSLDGGQTWEPIDVPSPS